MHYPWLDAPKTHFLRLLKERRLPHALLVGVDSGQGAESLLSALAQAALCELPTSAGACGHCKRCQLFVAGNHPDYYPVRPDGNQIKIMQIRSLCASLEATSQQGGHRVVVIYDADRMNTAAANALLKTLEEPGDNTLLLLHSNTPERLMPTLLSRCQRLTYSAPSQPEIIAWLTSQGLPVDALWCLPVVGGPVKLAQYIQNNEIGVLQGLRSDWQTSLSTGHLCSGLKGLKEEQVTDALNVLYIELLSVLQSQAAGNALVGANVAGLAGEVMRLCHSLATMPNVNYLALCQKIVSDYQRIKAN